MPGQAITARLRTAGRAAYPQHAPGGSAPKGERPDVAEPSHGHFYLSCQSHLPDRLDRGRLKRKNEDRLHISHHLPSVVVKEASQGSHSGQERAGGLPQHLRSSTRDQFLRRTCSAWRRMIPLRIRLSTAAFLADRLGSRWQVAGQPRSCDCWARASCGARDHGESGVPRFRRPALSGRGAEGRQRRYSPALRAARATRPGLAPAGRRAHPPAAAWSRPRPTGDLRRCADGKGGEQPSPSPPPRLPRQTRQDELGPFQVHGEPNWRVVSRVAKILYARSFGDLALSWGRSSWARPQAPRAVFPAPCLVTSSPGSEQTRSECGRDENPLQLRVIQQVDHRVKVGPT